LLRKLSKEKTMKYSVFTVCLPEYAPAEAARALADWGYDGVEWRFAERPEKYDPRGGFWSSNLAAIDPRFWEKEVPAVRKLCRSLGLKMPSLASYAGCHEPRKYEPAIEAAAALGAPLVRIGVPGYDAKIGYAKLLKTAVKNYERVVKYAARFKVRPVAEIHMGNIMASAAGAARFCGHFSPREMGVIHDAGNMVYEGYEQYRMGLEMLGGHLAHVHLKNARWEAVGGTPEGAVRYRPTWAPMKSGFVDFEALFGALRAVGYDGWVSLEDFNLAATADKMTDDLAYLKAVEKRCAAAK
jgi:sugar phosphate isomerase/epimerase